jgi:hypothetical protein
MVDWLKRLVVGDGNVVLERSYTNWNTLDVAAIVAAKKRERVEESNPMPPALSDKERDE